VIDRIAYSPYGEATRTLRSDVNGDGFVNQSDHTGIIRPRNGAAIGTATYVVEADLDRNGVINQLDYDICIADDGKSSSGGVGEAGLFSKGVRNSVGYCGYVFNEDSGLYTVRFRTYSPTLGRWLERDPAGYVDGMDLYEYVRGGAIDAVDPWGLWTGMDIEAVIGGTVDVEGSSDCFMTMWTSDEDYGHWWMEYILPHGELRAVGYWHSGWQSPAPDVQRYRRFRTRVHVLAGDDPYLAYRVLGDRSKLPEGATPVRMSRRDSGVLQFGASAGVPCSKATCAMIRDCMEKFEPQAPYRDFSHNCRVGLTEAYLSCCLKRARP
jgi:RHS repeat-associated protein